MTTVYFNLPQDDLEAVDGLAEQDDGNRSEVLRRAVHEYLYRQPARADASPAAIRLAGEDYEPVTGPEDLGSLGYDPDDPAEPAIYRRMRDGVFCEISIRPCPHLTDDTAPVLEIGYVLPPLSPGRAPAPELGEKWRQRTGQVTEPKP